MRYTSSMNRPGPHYHIRVGPEEISLFDGDPLAGPYLDIIYDDIDEAHDIMMRVIDGHIPDYLEQEEREEAYEYVEDVTTMLRLEESHGESYHIEELGFELTFSICSGCIPKGMN